MIRNQVISELGTSSSLLAQEGIVAINNRFGISPSSAGLFQILHRNLTLVVLTQDVVSHSSHTLSLFMLLFAVS